MRWSTPLAGILSLVLLAAVGVPGASAADWPQMGYGPAHNGFQRDETVIGPSNVGALRQIWKKRMTTEWGSPAVVGNRVYIGVRVEPTTPDGIPTGKLVVRTASTGKLVWRRGLDRPGYLSYPAVANGIVYITTQDWSSVDETGGTLYAFNADTGRLLWKKKGTEIRTSPTVADGMVFVAGGHFAETRDTVWAYDATTGALRWKTSRPAGFLVSETTAPTVAAGRVFLELPGNLGVDSIIALDEQTGAPLWRSTLPDGTVGSHLLVGKGLVIAPATSVGVFALDAATGQLRWSFLPENPDNTFWAAIASDTVYVTFFGTIPDGHGGNLEAALNLSDGSVKWVTVLPRVNVGIFGSPTVANGVVYVVGGFLYQIATLRASTGAPLDPITIPVNYTEGSFGTPVVAHGSVYAATSGRGGLYRFALTP